MSFQAKRGEICYSRGRSRAVQRVILSAAQVRGAGRLVGFRGAKARPFAERKATIGRCWDYRASRSIIKILNATGIDAVPWQLNRECSSRRRQVVGLGDGRIARVSLSPLVGKTGRRAECAGWKRIPRVPITPHSSRRAFAQGRRKSFKSACVVAKNGLFGAKSCANVAQAGPNLAKSGAFAHPPARGEVSIARGFCGLLEPRRSAAREVCDKGRWPIGGHCTAPSCSPFGLEHRPQRL
jgi:hypothetical protein